MREVLPILLLVACQSGSPSDTGPDVALTCPEYARGTSGGQTTSDDLVEVSGLAAGAGGALWAHNDSGDTARVFALATDGTHLAEVALAGTPAIDWEDMTAARDGDATTLYVGDIGDNRLERTSITLLRLPEPDLAATATSDWAALPAAYPDGAHNAETLLHDPQNRAASCSSSPRKRRVRACCSATPLRSGPARWSPSKRWAASTSAACPAPTRSPAATVSEGEHPDVSRFVEE